MKKIKLKHIFLLPIILTMIVSISHVTVWYTLTNEYLWAVFMSISVEIGAMVALVAATKNIKGNIWGMFFIVTFIQMIGNIFYSYKQIDVNGDLFKSWVELTGPVWEMLGSKANDVIAMKRWLSFLSGGLLPIISLTSLHFFTKYDEVKENPTKLPANIDIDELSLIAGKEESKFVEEKYAPTEDDLNRLEIELIKLNEKKFGSLEETIVDEPQQDGIKRLNYLRRDA